MIVSNLNNAVETLKLVLLDENEYLNHVTTSRGASFVSGPAKPKKKMCSNLLTVCRKVAQSGSGFGIFASQDDIRLDIHHQPQKFHVLVIDTRLYRATNLRRIFVDSPRVLCVCIPWHNTLL